MRSKRITALTLIAGIAISSSQLLAASPSGDAAAPWLQFAPFLHASTVALVSPGPKEFLLAPSNNGASVSDLSSSPRHLRRMLADFSMTLRNIRYRRGGDDPSTGFDCSGFVRYVFRHSVGSDLPTTSASQFHSGSKVARADMKVGDLVFFRTRGKRVSHVGIYLGDGHFIHSPSTGKRVSVSSLDETYWSRRFVGAKRPQVLT